MGCWITFAGCFDATSWANAGDTSASFRPIGLGASASTRKCWADEFINWIALHPEAGDVIPGSGGCRKVRWAASGRGKSGGARVIYFNATEQAIWLLIVYTKSKFDNLPTSFLAELKQGVEDAF